MKTYLLVVVLAFPCAAPCAAAPAVDWRPDLATALAEASAAGRTVFVDFYARWCGPCRVLERITFLDSAFVGFASTRVCVRVDVERDTASARRYQVRAYPTLVLLRGDGSEIDRIVGAPPTVELVSQLEEFSAGRGTLDTLLAQEATRGDDPAFTLQLAGRLQDHGRVEEAARRYLRIFGRAAVDTTGAAERAGFALAVMRYTYGPPTAAVLACRSWIERFPASPSRPGMLLLLGNAEEAAGDLAAANSAYRAVVEKYPSSREADEARERLQSLR